MSEWDIPASKAVVKPLFSCSMTVVDGEAEAEGVDILNWKCWFNRKFGHKFESGLGSSESETNKHVNFVSNGERYL